MATFFEKNPQKVRQWGSTRRNGGSPSGTCVVHTAENATDFIGPDAGAESVARYFLTAGRQASYHLLADSDSWLHVVPWASEAWHDTRTNNWSVGGSIAIQCKDWKKLGARGDKAVQQLAEGFAAYAEWLYKKRGILIPAKRITRAQALARTPGFIGHGEMDPGRRSDPGADFNWTLFLAEFKKRRDRRLGLGKKKLAVSGGFTPDVAAELQRQLGKLEVDSIFGKESVKRYRSRINAKNGKGGFKLTNGPLKGGDTLTSRDIKAGEKLINVWHKRTKGKGKDFVLVKGPLKLTGKLSGRTASAFRKSLNDNLWE